MLHAWPFPILFLCHTVTLPVNLYQNTVMCCLPATGIKSQTNLFHIYVTQCQVIPHSNTEQTTGYNDFIKEQKKMKIVRVSICPTAGEVKVPGLKYNSISQYVCLFGKTLSKTTQLKLKGWELGGEQKETGTAGKRKINTLRGNRKREFS